MGYRWSQSVCYVLIITWINGKSNESSWIKLIPPSWKSRRWRTWINAHSPSTTKDKEVKYLK